MYIFDMVFRSYNSFCAVVFKKKKQSGYFVIYMDISEKLINLIEYYGSIISYEYVHDKNYFYFHINR